ncbi:type IV secretion system protein [Clavibacter seminis]|uniref:Type IV secretion system protein n=3 Tax=Clavibacter TaxID=1573 RepID=A0ABY3T6T2_9MICO|nr:type IV secretion system protein [Clavibacter sp. A6099]UKF24835.1 type IV secretion system protein [Clavibacter sp. A6099]
MSCGFGDLVGCGTDAIASAIEQGAKNTLEQLMDAALETFGKVVASLGTMWVYIPGPQFTKGEGSTVGYEPNSTVTGDFDTLLGYVAWIGLVVAVLSIIGFAILYMRARSSETGMDALGRLGLVLGGVFLITSASSLVAWVIPKTAPDGSTTAVGFLQNSTWFVVLAMAVGSVILAGIRLAWTQRAEPVRELLRSLVTLVMVSTIGLTVIQLAVRLGDAFAVGVLNAATKCDVADVGGNCFGSNIALMMQLTAQSPLGTIGVLILALIAILISYVQIAMMIVRSAMLVLLAGILPLTASFTNTPTGNQWFRKSLGWLTAFILYKPAAALVYAAAFRLIGTDLFAKDGQGIWAVLTGVALMLIALIALPALMRFIAPMVAPAGGVSGAAVAGAVMGGAGEAASGAIKQAGSMATRSNGGGGGGGGGGSASGPSGAANASAGARSGTAAKGAAAGAKAGAGASGAAAGGAAGGAAAAGAAVAGPVGLAALGVAKLAEGAKKAAHATRGAVEDAAGEGPSGAR